MIVTVEEAATKRCQEAFPASNGTTTTPNQALTFSAPFSMISAPYGAGASVAVASEQSPTAPFYCIGPQCMAWKWAIDPQGNQWRTDDGQMLGYCGKARR